MCSEYGQYMNGNCHLCRYWTLRHEDFAYKCNTGICPANMRSIKENPVRIMALEIENQRLRERIAYLESKNY